MKLLYLANLRLPTEKAYGIQIAKMCEVFTLEGLEVELVAPYRHSDIKEDFFSYYSLKNQFKFKKIWAPDFYWPGKLDKFAFLVKSLISELILVFYSRSGKADIYYSRDEFGIFLLSFFVKPEKIIFEAHNFSPKRAFFYRRFKNKNIRIVAISEAIKKDFINLGFSPEKILVAHDGVDISLFDINIGKTEAREKTNLSGNKIVMYTGHLFEWKGAEVLAKVAKILPDFLFVFIGGTVFDINKFRSKFGKENNIKILGHRPYKEIPVFLKSADVLVLPNISKDKISNYTSPLKLFEYMASGRPIVASDLPSIKEILNDNNAVLVMPDSVEDLAQGIKKVLADEDFGNQIARKSYEESKNYTWQARAKRIINFIKND